MLLLSRHLALASLASCFSFACGDAPGTQVDGGIPSAGGPHSVTMRLRNQSPVVGVCDFAAKWTERDHPYEVPALAGEYVTPEAVRSEVRAIATGSPVTFVTSCAAQNEPSVPDATAQIQMALTKDCAVDASYRVVRHPDGGMAESTILYVSDC